MLRQKIQRAISFARKRVFYWIQRGTGWGINPQLEKRISIKATAFLALENETVSDSPAMRLLEDFDFSEKNNYSVIRDDIYRRFVTRDDGVEIDELGRTGNWIPRGCHIYFDHSENVYIKVFDEYFCARGEGRFLPEALEKGVYKYLCPALAYVIFDKKEKLRGYAIHAGRVLSPYEFERYVEVALRDAICEITKQSDLYFYDLTYHNTILWNDTVSLIDLESILPLSWYGTDEAFSVQMLHEIDIGFPIQKKFHSPSWYAAYIDTLTAREPS